MVDERSKPRIAIVGTVGLPAAYSGFETLAEHLVRYNERKGLPLALTIYCSARHFDVQPPTYHGATLRYLNLDANNASSLIYDAVSMTSAIHHGVDTILLLGVSGAWAIPFVRLFSNARIVTNIDGIEWRREKWRGIAKWILRASEWIAARWSHELIADNGAIVDHVRQAYDRDSVLISYGGDHALVSEPLPFTGLPDRYALALCRIEPENNVSLILEAFAADPTLPLVFIGNWDRSHFGRDLKQRYGSYPHIHIIDPVYDVATLHTIRAGCSLYIHGHSAGGTNPSLVEMMHFGKPILAFDCVFNRHSTEDAGLYFHDVATLRSLIEMADHASYADHGAGMASIARARYTWDQVGAAYVRLLSHRQ